MDPITVSAGILIMLQSNVVLQHTVFVVFFLFLFISFFQYCYEMLIMPLYGFLYVGYAYNKSMGVEFVI